MPTYKYEISFQKNGKKTYDYVRASNGKDACIKACEVFGEIKIISVSRIGN